MHMGNRSDSRTNANANALAVTKSRVKIHACILDILDDKQAAASAKNPGFISFYDGALFHLI